MQQALSDGRQHWPRGVRVRLAWADRFVHRHLGTPFRLRLVHPAFLSRLFGAQLLEPASISQRGLSAAGEMWMDFIAPAGGAPRSIASARDQAPAPAADQSHPSVSAPATTIMTVVRHVVARDIVRPVFSRPFESIDTRVADMSAAKVPDDRPASAPPRDRVGGRVRDLPPILLVSRRELPITAAVGRRELLPAARPLRLDTRPAAPVAAARRAAGSAQMRPAAVPEPSLVDRLIASAERGAALEPLSLRVFAPSPMPEAPATAASSEGGSQTRPYVSSPGTVAGVPTRLSRAELDLLVNKVATLLARRDRLARESKGII